MNIRFRTIMTIVAMVAASVLLTAPSAGAAGDDYPHSTATECSNIFGWSSWCVEENGQPGFQNGEQWSERGYDYRNCTDFVAWRAAQHGVDVSGLGSAGTWDDRAASKGFTVTNVPAPNMVAQSEGHVAWVTAVSTDETRVWIEDYNNAHPVDGDYRSPREVSASSYRYIDLGVSAGSGGGSVSGNPNGSFESSTGGWARRVGTGTTNFVRYVDAAKAHDGKGLLATNTSGSGSIYKDTSTSIAAGDAIVVDAWVRSQSGTASGRLCVWALGTTANQNNCESYSVGMTYEPLQVVLDSAGAHSSMRIELYPAANGGTTYLDSVSAR